MNIVLFVSEFPPKAYAGLATYSYNIANRLSKNNHVIVNPIPAYPFILRYALGPRFVYNMDKTICRLKKNGKIDIVYAIAFGPEFSFIGPYVKALNLPLVFHGVGTDIYNYHPLGVLGRKIAYSIADQLICGTQFQREVMVKEGAQPERVHVILGGVDTRTFRPLQSERDKSRKSLELEDKFVLLSLGRLTKRKGFDDAIKALAYLDDINEVFLLVAGKGPEKLSLIELAKSLSVDDKVRFLGFVASDYLPAIYNTADLFVAPFRTIRRDMEGFPLVVQEAQACGIPVISTNTPGPPELVENDKSGFIVEMNSPEKIAEKIRVLYKDRKLLEDMARNARKRAEGLLDWNITVRGIEKILQGCLNSK